MANADLKPVFKSTLDHGVLAELATASVQKHIAAPPKVTDQIGSEISAMFNECSEEVSFVYTISNDDTQYYGLNVAHQMTPASHCRKK